MSLLSRSDSDTELSSRAELAAACRDKDYERANHLILAGADPLLSTTGFFKWTPLHFLSQHGELDFAKILIEVYECRPQAEDLEGRTPLHIACEFGNLTMVRYLVRNQQCDPEYLDFEEQTPLHHACGWLSECSEDKAVSIAKFLIKSAKCDPNRKDLNGKDALLHACEKGLLNVARYLIEDCGCDVNVTDHRGNTLSHLAVSYANNLDLVRYLLPNISVELKNLDGNTLLHSACAANGDLEIVKTLLKRPELDPSTENNQGKTPIELTTDQRIAILLISYGASPSNVYNRYGRELSLDRALEPLVNIFAVGDSSSGKTTLLRSLQKEPSLSSLSLSFSQHKFQRIEEKTKGIELQEDFVSGVFGRVNFFDLAGSDEYRSSNAAILRHATRCNLPLFLLVVDLSKSENEIKQTIEHWMAFLSNHCSTLNGATHDVVLIGTHTDVVKSSGEDPKKKLKNLNLDNLFSVHSKLKLLGRIAVDCHRSESSGIAEVRQILKMSQERLQTLSSINFNTHCLYKYLQTEFVENIAISLGHLQSSVSKLPPENTLDDLRHYIPDDQTQMLHCCEDLHRRGHILFLKHTACIEKSAIVTDRVALLSEVLGSTCMYSLSRSSQNPSLSSYGVVSQAEFAHQLSAYDTDGLTLALSHLELTQILPNKDILVSNKGDTKLDDHGVHSSEGVCYLYIPSLVSRSSPESGEIWDPQPYFSFNSGWMLRCANKDQRFDSYFIDVLFHRYTTLFLANTPSTKTPIDNECISSVTCEVQCSFWKGGSYSSNIHGVESILECTDNQKNISLLVRSGKVTPHALRLRSQLIAMVLNARTEFSRCVSVTESLMDPFEVMEYPLKPTSLLTVFDVKQVALAILESKSLSVSGTDNEISVQSLLTFDPYLLFKRDILECIFDKEQPVYELKVSDTFLSELAPQILPHCDILMELLSYGNTAIGNKLQEKEQQSDKDSESVVEGLKAWRENSEGTYRCLRETLDRFSVLAGRNPLVLLDKEWK